MTGSGHDTHPSTFESTFNDEERRLLLKEDREAQLGISAILGVLIAIGMMLGIFSVTLITKFGLR
ncbi:MAG: hypothetical protein KDA92_05655 [Planctomycetales bacterium]|nr:hypothetical protein [Planctomycetales bacterium]MCA9167898.1 hypothetical protein [Planctomycetales bacterium]